MKRPLPTGEAIRRFRKDLNMSQEQLAGEAGISIQYIRLLEAGGRHDVGDDKKRAIARALNVSVWTVFPDVPMRVDLFRLLKSVHGNRLVIRDEEIPMYKEVLSRLAEYGDDERIDSLIESGVQPSDVKKYIRAWAREMNIEIVK